MKCTKCGFVSYNHMEVCKRCGKQLPKPPSIPKKSNVYPLKIASNPQLKEHKQSEIKPDNVLSIKKITSTPKPDIPVISESPIPQKQHELNNSSQLGIKDEIKKPMLSIDPSEDDYNLITEAPTEHLTLDNLPVLNRFIAAFIDIAILLFVNFVLLVLSTQIIGVNINSLLSVKLYLIALFLLMHYLYYLYFTIIYQATPGKLVMKLRVISLASLRTTRLTFSQITWRWLGLVGGVLVLFGGYIYMLFDDLNAAMHDRLSLSLVISKEQNDALQIEHLNR